MTRDALKELKHWAVAAAEQLQPLPPSAYVSPELLQLEIEKLFYKEWICVGHVSELEQPGSYLTFEIIDKPVLVVRDDSNEIRAYSNVCMHRGALLVEGRGRRKLFTCPYHAWTYGLDGRLRRAPYMDDDAIPSLCLPEFPLEVWHGLIFVSLDAATEPLEPRLSELEPRIAQYDFTRFRVVHRSDNEITCNWKVLVENFCESYHVFCVHKATLETDTPTSTVEVQPGGPGFNHHTMTIVSRNETEHLMCFYPSLVFTCNRTSLLWLIVQPTGPQSLRYTVELATLPDAEGSIADDQVDDRLELISTFMAEDKAIIECVQRGLASSPTLAGILHPFERTNWEFGHYLVRLLTGT